MTYLIIRLYRNGRKSKIIREQLTLEEAQEHCKDPSTRTADWFDGYHAEE